MERKMKTLAAFKYKALGFTVIIRDAPLVGYGDDSILDISPQVIGDTIFKQLADYPARLTGNHVKFIRKHSRMTQSDFAERFGVTQPAVIKWEKKGDKPAEMAWSTEKDMRMFIVVHTIKSAEKFRKMYEKLSEIPDGEPKPFVYRVSARKKLVAA